MVGFWYNPDLFNKAGIAAPPATWAELLEDVRKLREAGIIPIALGENEQWPGGFYWTYLALRIGGLNAFDAAVSRTGSFADPAFVEAGIKLRELIGLSPFPEGFLDLNYPGQSALMGDGAAAMELMGEWAPGAAANARADPQGTGPVFGFFPFPVVEGGAGSAADALGESMVLSWAEMRRRRRRTSLNFSPPKPSRSSWPKPVWAYRPSKALKKGCPIRCFYWPIGTHPRPIICCSISTGACHEPQRLSSRMPFKVSLLERRPPRKLPRKSRIRQPRKYNISCKEALFSAASAYKPLICGRRFLYYMWLPKSR